MMTSIEHEAKSRKRKIYKTHESLYCCNQLQHSNAAKRLVVYNLYNLYE